MATRRLPATTPPQPLPPAPPTPPAASPEASAPLTVPSAPPTPPVELPAPAPAPSPAADAPPSAPRPAQELPSSQPSQPPVPPEAPAEALLKQYGQPDLLGIKAIAHYLRCSYPTAQDRILRYGLPAARIGSQWFSWKAAIDEWVNRFRTDRNARKAR